jgi:hypothetical protein
MEMDQRIHNLERQVRQFRILFGLMALAALAAILVGANKPVGTTLKGPL